MKKPNILLFYTDDQRFDTLSGLGHPIVKTPVIDGLMARGTTFTHAHVGKQNSYEHSVRVPMIFAGPGIPEGERRDDYVYLLDIYPTLCDLLGITTPENAEGQSLKGVLGDADVQVRDTLFTAYCEYQRMVKDERFKLIEYVVDGRPTTQLFDLEMDPLEIYNLANDSEYSDRIGE